MTMKHDRDQETDEQRRGDGDSAEEKLDPIPMAWETALGPDDDDEASADEVARGEDLEQSNSDEQSRD